MELFAIKDGKVVDSTGNKLPISKVREILTAAVHTQEKAPLEERKKLFSKLVESWSHKSPGKYPASFYLYFIDIWTATNEWKGTEEMKVELAEKEYGKQFTFRIGGRLATVWNNCPQDQKNEMWSKDEKNNSQPKQGTLL